VDKILDGDINKPMKTADEIFVWFVLLAIVAVVTSSGQIDPLIQAVTKLLTSLIGIIVAPQNGATR